MSQYNKFYAYLSELHQNYEKLFSLLQKKLEAVERFDIEKLDSILKEEQVFVLISKGFDQTIKGFRESLGLKGDSLSNIIGELPTEEHQRFQAIFKELDTTLSAVKGLNEKCQLSIQDRLYSLDKSIKELDKTATTTYSKDKSTQSGGSDPHILTKSV